ncbi:MULTISPECIES: hypothetical protein [unclassified Clostridium]|uniref:hypothetical protein n=1 Tax=unclassified Clostridium TaxID=2614128 RepID=UPI0025B99D6A|nr:MULTISPECIES: hypothetical protein [unclassified Clostridium]
MKKRYKVILYSTITFFIIYFLVKKSIIDLNILHENHINFITINSVFAGFLFTSLGIMLSLAFNEALIKLERTTIMDSIYVNIILGILFSISSIIISISNLLLDFTNVKLVVIQEVFKYFMPTLELTLLLLTIFQFVLSVNNTRFVIRIVRNNIRKKFPDKESMKKTLDKIK